MAQDVFDVIVIGGGPAGLSECLRLQATDLNIAVVSDVFGGCMGMMGALPLQSYCNELEISGAPIPLRKFLNRLAISPTGEEYSNYIRSNFETLPLTRFEERVMTLSKSGEFFELVLGDASAGKTLRASQVILATGIRPRAAPLEAEMATWRSCFDVYTQVSNGQIDTFSGKDVFIFGSGNSAFQIALLLAPVARNITVLVKSYLGLYPQETNDRFALRSLSQRTLEMIAKCGSESAQGPINGVATTHRAHVWLHAYSDVQACADSLLLTLPHRLNSHALLEGSCNEALRRGRLGFLNDGSGYRLMIDCSARQSCLVSATGVTAQLPDTEWPQLIDSDSGFAAHCNGQTPIEGLHVAGAVSGYASVNTMLPASPTTLRNDSVQERVSWA
ncbi:copper transporter [Pseudomonas floridensis]|uniref:Copper transporter n=2 Tax=Pseudomonas floridensis TaxID=1958950 RepID=A0A1X0MZ92_9PSED|nr:copper transporter [Pseudomonas floridensis]